MNLEELLAREQIRSTLIAYNRAGDNDDADGFAACFTDDGIFHGAGLTLEGREAIRAWKASGVVFRDNPRGRAAPFRVHHLSSIHIDLLSHEEASARSCWFVVTDIGPDHSGLYHDRLRRVDGQWLIANRVARCLWRAENSYVSPDIVEDPPIT